MGKGGRRRRIIGGDDYPGGITVLVFGGKAMPYFTRTRAAEVWNRKAEADLA